MASTRNIGRSLGQHLILKCSPRLFFQPVAMPKHELFNIEEVAKAQCHNLSKGQGPLPCPKAISLQSYISYSDLLHKPSYPFFEPKTDMK